MGERGKTIRNGMQVVTQRKQIQVEERRLKSDGQNEQVGLESSGFEVGQRDAWRDFWQRKGV